MKSDALIPVFFLLAAVSGRAQEISSFTLKQAPAKPPGTFIATLKAKLPPGVDYVIEDSPDLVIWNRVSPLLRPPGGVLEWSHAQSEPFPRDWIAPFHQTAESDWNTRRFYRVRALPPADAAAGVFPRTPVGRLQQAESGGPLSYTTRGGWTVKMDLSTITVTDPSGKTTYQHWGHPHENLNGKHLKDWFTAQRTMLLPGDAMITLKAHGPHGVVEAVSIYDADQTHKIDATNNTVTMSVLLVRVGEAAEADGETMRIWHVGGGRYYAENIYTQDEPGDGTSARQEAVPLGSTGGDANPKQVNDLIDDPQLGHT